MYLFVKVLKMGLQEPEPLKDISMPPPAGQSLQTLQLILILATHWPSEEFSLGTVAKDIAGSCRCSSKLSTHA